ncbi:hypothetical protein DPMN_035655 [Dreissena polymorpha]|uniref:VHS domain-containing protein n=1 Tax=Dreissena polymorpha TaxID=45954 RepID=A0A9D4MB08_DREPO|nr:hypothetical protein DPMN_035655 [Dreissena polymorpha]
MVKSVNQFLLCVLVERATDGSQPSENWAVYMEVCDRINETEEGYVTVLTAAGLC